MNFIDQLKQPSAPVAKQKDQILTKKPLRMPSLCILINVLVIVFNLEKVI